MNALFKSGNDSAAQCSAFFLKYLHGRGYSTDSTTPKGKKSTNTSSDSEYRVILDHFLSDVLAVLHFPEWPIAEIIVNLYGRMAVSWGEQRMRRRV